MQGEEKKRKKNLFICKPNLGLDSRTNTCIFFFLNQFLDCELIEVEPFLIQLYDIKHSNFAHRIS